MVRDVTRRNKSEFLTVTQTYVGKFTIRSATPKVHSTTQRGTQKRPTGHRQIHHATSSSVIFQYRILRLLASHDYQKTPTEEIYHKIQNTPLHTKVRLPIPMNAKYYVLRSNFTLRTVQENVRHASTIHEKHSTYVPTNLYVPSNVYPSLRF